jgi:hypothetical protein
MVLTIPPLKKFYVTKPRIKELNVRLSMFFKNCRTTEKEKKEEESQEISRLLKNPCSHGPANCT